jgi:hypothetical protein
VKAIETTYNGYRFRSRLEARVAVLLDAARIKYVYEPEGFVFDDGTTYLPDLYLPDMYTFLECKGIMSGKDEHKIELLAKETHKEIVIFDSELNPLVGEYVDDVSGYYPSEKKPGLVIQDAFIGRCRLCKKVFFGSINGSWHCRCCGWDDGNGTSDWLYSYESMITDYEPIKKARYARFEHGEEG